jgi:5-dehydro-2-deoxygluconokinase
VDTTDPDVAADRLLDLGLEIAVVKLGPAGVLAKTHDQRVLAPAYPVQVVNGLGAGDGFGGAFSHGVLAKWTLEDTITFANVAGAIVASRLGCSEAMPTREEIEVLMEGARIAK